MEGGIPMARYICPSCGKRYNGKCCKACLYENFSEEFSHGGHTHTGEPLVIDQLERSPIPKRDPFACDKPTKKKRWLPVVVVAVALLLFQPVLALIFGIGQEISQAVSLANQPQPEVPEWAFPLFNANGIELLADFGKDGICTEEFPLYLRNNTKHKVRVYAESVVVNGFLMEGAYVNCEAGKNRTAAGTVSIDLYLRNNTKHKVRVYAESVVVNGFLMEGAYVNCEAGKNRTAAGTVSIDSDDLAMAGISQIQTLRFTIGAYDQDDYAELIPPQTIQLSFVDPSQYTQPQAPQGQVLYQDDRLTLTFLGYLPGLYNPDISDGDLLFYLENRAQKPLNISLESAVLNGQEVDLSLWCSLPAGTRNIYRSVSDVPSDGPVLGGRCLAYRADHAAVGGAGWVNSASAPCPPGSNSI